MLTEIPLKIRVLNPDKSEIKQKGKVYTYFPPEKLPDNRYVCGYGSNEVMPPPFVICNGGFCEYLMATGLSPKEAERNLLTKLSYSQKSWMEY